jgi:flavin reductase (DIM6/NTAB) family NADH-FMN oxidoreductase RutF
MDNQLKFELSGADALRATFRKHASGVAIITGTDQSGSPIGFTATSVTSLGSNPPLVSFNIAQGSSSYSQLTIGKLVGLHTLGADDVELAQRLAGPKDARFTDDHITGPEGVPVFPCVSSILLGRIVNRFEVESNAVVVFRVESGWEGQDKSPLLYFQRGYLAAGERLRDNY